MAVLSSDYFSIPEEEIKNLESVLTIVGGTVVYAKGEFLDIAPPDLPVSPDWSPVTRYGGYAGSEQSPIAGAAGIQAMSSKQFRHAGAHETHRSVMGEQGLWSLGCDCFAF
jgi:hypothetical protein